LSFLADVDACLRVRNNVWNSDIHALKIDGGVGSGWDVGNITNCSIRGVGDSAHYEVYGASNLMGCTISTPTNVANLANAVIADSLYIGTNSLHIGEDRISGVDTTLSSSSSKIPTSAAVSNAIAAIPTGGGITFTNTHPGVESVPVSQNGTNYHWMAVGMSGVPRFKALATNSQSIASTSLTLLNFQTDTFDPYNMFNTSTAYFRPITSGVWNVSCRTFSGSPLSAAAKTAYGLLRNATTGEELAGFGYLIDGAHAITPGHINLCENFTLYATNDYGIYIYQESADAEGWGHDTAIRYKSVFGAHLVEAE
jgi:hypothetical protein